MRVMVVREAERGPEDEAARAEEVRLKESSRTAVAVCNMYFSFVLLAMQFQTMSIRNGKKRDVRAKDGHVYHR
jgi:hypothetical protein